MFDLLMLMAHKQSHVTVMLNKRHIPNTSILYTSSAYYAR